MKKTNKLWYAVMAFGLLFFGITESQAQSVGTPNGNTAFFNTNTAGKLLGHREAGSFGSFSSFSQWIGIGQPTAFLSSSAPKVPAYGLRSQWSGQAGIFALKNSGSVKDLAIEWGANSSSKLKFNFITNLSNPSALKEVMTLTSSGDGAVGIGTNTPGASLDIRTATRVGSSDSYGLRTNVTASGFRAYASSFTINVPNGYEIYGVNSRATSGASFAVYGGRFFASNNSTGSANAYGVFASTGGTAANRWAGYFVGNVYISGALTVASDKKFKKNIKSLSKTSVTSKLMALNPSTYLYKNTEALQFTEGMQYGFLAQEVEEIFPELVKDVVQPVYDGVDEAGNPKPVEGESLEFKSINYLGLIPVLTKALQEQETKIATYEATVQAIENKLDEQVALNADLTEKLNNLMTKLEANDEEGSTIDVPTTSETSLGQNMPNPFGQATEITYSLASTVRDANIQIYNMDGKLLADYRLDKDANSIQLKANQYQPGVYIYVMMADGETIGTRRMIVSQ